MISGLFIFNQKGEVLISRLYRTDLKRSVADVFRVQVISNPDVRSPVITLGSTSFFHVRNANVYVLAVTKCNANAALIYEFLYRFISIAKAYFGKLDEESVKNNFVMIYELIDEILDFGYPQNTEIGTLKRYITSESIRSEIVQRDASTKITAQATDAVTWRRPNIKHKKNEAFVDVTEDVNLIMSASGTVLRADVVGVVTMKANLSGMPECRFGLNDKLILSSKKGGSRSEGVGDYDADVVELDDCTFHQCVQLEKFDSDRSISFIPPDNQFNLMTYRSSSNVNLPLRVQPIVTEVGKSQVEYTVAVKATFNTKLHAEEIVLKIPTPLNTTKVNCEMTTGKAKYVPEDNIILWTVQRLQGGSEITLSATADLTSTTNRQPWTRPPIDVDFKVMMFTASGLLVRFLKIYEASGYTSVKWVRYVTQAAGTYQIRF